MNEPFESDDAASDAQLADELELEQTVGGPAPDGTGPAHPAGESVLPPADPSSAGPAQSGPRHSRRRSAAPDENLRGPEPGGDEPRRRKPRRKGPWWELPLLAAVAILIAVLVKSFLIQPFYIPSASMEQTLHGCPGCSGDRILVNKIIYDFRDPHPGDIVVFHAPPGWDDEPASTPPSNPVLRTIRGFGQLIGFVPPDGLVLVKRVIAIGGQTVKGVSVDGHDKVMVSDHGTAGPWHTLVEPFTYYDGPDSHADFGPVTVPKGRLWVMGDHRNDSADSRFHCDLAGSGEDTGANCSPTTSTVPDSDVIGKAFVIAWPPSRWRTLGTPKTFEQEFASAAGVAGGAVPVGGAAALVLPVWLVRRRRR